MNLKKALLAFFTLFTSITTPELSANQSLRSRVNNDSAVVVYFYKSSCPYCVFMRPLINRIKQEFGDKITFIEVSGNNSLKKEFGFSTFPTVMYFKDGKKVQQHGSNNRRITTAQMKSYAQTLCC